MISNNAQRAFGEMLVQGIKASLLASPDEPIAVTPVAQVEGIAASEIVMLSISSYFFRLVVLVYFTPDEQTKAHFARLNKVPVSAMDAQALVDAIHECGNICCGSINRALSAVFPHVGMSTPNIMDKRCAHYRGVLESSHEQHVAIAIPGGPRLHASLCIKEFADLDFEIEAVPVEAGGELEMF